MSAIPLPPHPNLTGLSPAKREAIMEWLEYVRAMPEEDAAEIERRVAKLVEKWEHA